ncbi:MAG: ATP-binding protein [Nanoarchaeota archaeon]
MFNTIQIYEFPKIVGQEETKFQVNSALLSGRNIILVGPPGVGKTTLAKNVAETLPELTLNTCSFHCDPNNPLCPKCKTKNQEKKIIKGFERFMRIQGSPDLTVEDLFGDIDPIKALQFGPLSTEAFTPGKIFKANHGVLFFDELNRCPEKLQNALLQVLEEKKVTIGSYDIDFPANFIFIATMNPDDFTGTEKLSEVLLDRFDMIYLDYPKTTESEIEILKKSGKNLNINFPENLMIHMTVFVRSLRENKDLERVPSVRATIGLYERAQSNALLENKKIVSLKNIQDAIFSVLVHRIKLKPSLKYLKTPENFIHKQFKDYCRDHNLAINEPGDAG